VKRQEAASSFESPIGAFDLSPIRAPPAAGARERRPRCGRPGSVLPRISTLSPNAFSVLGERARVRGPEGVDIEDSRFAPTHSERATKRMIRDLARNAPSPVLSPRIAATLVIRGERR
jgi:hypothetical protein